MEKVVDNYFQQKKRKKQVDGNVAGDKCLGCKCCKIVEEIKRRDKIQQSKNWRLEQEIIPQERFRGNEKVNADGDYEINEFDVLHAFDLNLRHLNDTSFGKYIYIFMFFYATTQQQ